MVLWVTKGIFGLYGEDGLCMIWDLCLSLRLDCFRLMYSNRCRVNGPVSCFPVPDGCSLHFAPNPAVRAVSQSSRGKLSSPFYGCVHRRFSLMDRCSLTADLTARRRSSQQYVQSPWVYPPPTHLLLSVSHFQLHPHLSPTLQ